MSRNRIDLYFADGVYDFALPAPRIDELQKKTGIGIGGLFNRLLKGVVVHPITGKTILDPGQAQFFHADIVETVRQGLIGGGRGVVNDIEVQVTPVLAEQLIRNYVLDRPLTDSWSMAASILGACVVGYDPPKKDVPASKAGARSRRKGKSKKAGSTTASS